MSDEPTQTRAARSAERRRRLFATRFASTTTDRQRLSVLVGWWMAEWCRLPQERRRIEFDRLKDITSDLNRRAES